MKKLYSFTSLLTLCLLACGFSSFARTAPVITRQPSNDTVCSGVTALFSLATDDSTAAFIWEVSRDGVSWDTITSDTTHYLGATNDTLLVVSADTMSGYMFRASASNDSGIIVSSSVTLVVNPLPVAGTLSGSAPAVCISTPVTLISTIASGTWRTSDTAVATIASTGVVTILRNGNVTFTYRVTNSCGHADSTFMLHIDTVLAHEVITAPSAICVGSTVRVVTSRPGGNWAVANGNASVSTTGWVTGVSNGTDTLIYIYSNACNADTSMASFMIDTAINAGSISGVSRVCNGSTVAFTATHPGGTWLSSNGTVAVSDASGNVTGRSVGTATISYFFTNSCGIAAALDTITVQVPASAILGTDSVGVGFTITLTDSATGGTWSTTDTAITINATTGLVTGAYPGTAVARYSITNICGTFSRTKLIYVGNAPAIADILGQDSVCATRSTQYYDSTAGGTWSLTNTNASVTAGGLVTGLVGETFDTLVYTYTNAFGTSSVSKIIKISNNPPVVTISGPATFLLAVPYTLTANPAGGTWVSLNPANVFFTTATNFVILHKGITKLVYTYTNACGTTRDTFTVDFPADNSVAANNGTSISDALNVFPNPTNGSIMVGLNSAYNEEMDIVVSSVTGQVITSVTTSTNQVSSLDLHVAAGVYFIKASTSHGKYTTRLTVE